MVFEESITVLGGRALLWFFRWLAADPLQHGHRVLALIDSVALAFCVAKMRSGTFSMLQICRRLADLRFATGIRPYTRWLTSEKNAADKASRVYMNDSLFADAVDRMHSRLALVPHQSGLVQPSWLSHLRNARVSSRW